jgi:predicted transcriptional regulator
MVYHNLKEEIVGILKKENACSREEINKNLKEKPNRAILMGYLRSLSDLGILISKDVGRAKVYFLGGDMKESDNSLKEEIVGILKRESACSRAEINKKLKEKPNRAILMGYLRCLSDSDILISKDVGKAKIYFLGKELNSKGGKK